MPKNKITNNKLNIAIAISSFFPSIGGAQVTAHNLASYLHEKNHKVTMIISWKNWKKIKNENFSYRIVPMLPGHQSLIGKKIIGRIYSYILNKYLYFLTKKYKFNVWQSFGTYPMGISICKFLENKNTTHIIRTVGYDIQKNKDVSYGYRFDQTKEKLIIKWAKKCTKAIALSESVINDLLEIDVKKNQIEIIPCGVDLSRFNSINPNVKQIREKYGLPKNKFLYICVGRNHEKKGFNYLVDAFNILSQKKILDNKHLVIIGDKVNKLKKQINELNLSSHITLIEELGIDDNDDYYVPSKSLIELYKSSDACVFPSLIETFAMINIEAMASSIPVISTNAPGCKESIIDNYDGLLSEPGNAKDLAKKIDQIYSSIELRKKLIANGKNTISSKYDWKIIGKKFENLYYTEISNKGE